MLFKHGLIPQRPKSQVVTVAPNKGIEWDSLRSPLILVARRQPRKFEPKAA